MENQTEFNIERSPQLQEQITRVRNLPQETGGEKDIKKREAQLLRMEALLTNVELNRLLIGQISVNPELTPKIFLEEAVKRRIVEPEATKMILETFAELRRRVVKYFDLYMKEAGDDSDVAGEMVFRKLVKEKPESRVTLSPDFGFALRLKMSSDKDLQKIYSGIGYCGGFFDEEVPGRYNGLTGEIIEYYPLIAELSGGITGMFHEDYHARSAVFRKGLKKAGRITVWGKEISSTQVFEVSQLLKKRFEVDPEEARKSDEFKRLVHTAASLVKDEYLARLSEFKPPNEDMALDLDNKLRIFRASMGKGGLYDYFLNYFSIDKDSSLYEALWEEYDNLLKTIDFDYIRKPLFIYSDLGLNYRAFLYRGVLMQFPLEDWPRQLHDSLFEEETKRLDNLWIKSVNIPPFIFPLRLKANYVIAKFKEAALAREPNKPIFDLIEQAEKKLGIVYKPIKNK